LKIPESKEGDNAARGTKEYNTFGGIKPYQKIYDTKKQVILCNFQIVPEK